MKTLRQLSLSRIRADPVLSRRYSLATGGWQRRLLRSLGSWIVLPASALLIGVLVALLGALMGGGVQKAPPGVYYLVIAGISLVIAITHAGWVLRELIRSRSLAVISVLPVSDQDFVSDRVFSSLLKTLLFLAGTLLLGAGISLGAETNAVETVQILLLSTLLWAMMAALSVIVPAFLPVVYRQEFTSAALGFFMLVAAGGVVLTEIGFFPPGLLVHTALIVLPTGWPVLMIEYGVMQKVPEAWWLLFPTGCVLTLAVAGYLRLLNRYQIQEFASEPGSLAAARFGSFPRHQPETPKQDVSSGRPVERRNWWRTARQRLRRWLQLPDESEHTEDLSREQAIARVREFGLTRRFDWSSSGLVERVLARLLTDEELTTAELLAASVPQWSKGLAWPLGAATAAIALVVAFAITVNPKIAMISGHIGFFGIFGVLAGNGLAAIWRSHDGESCALLALEPIDFQRLSRISMTIGAVRGVVVFPFVTAVALIIFWGHDGQIALMESALAGARVALIFTALHQWAPLFLLPYSYSKSVGQTLRDIVAGVLIGLSAIAGGCLVLLSGDSEILAVTGAGLLFGTGRLVLYVHQRRVLTAPADFVVQTSANHTVLQNQQSRNRPSDGPVFWPRPVETAGLT